MNLSKIRLEIIDKWLHSTKDGQSVIEVLINTKEFEYVFYPYDFKKIDPSVTNFYGIPEVLNEYFSKNDYPFEAHSKIYSGYIKKTRPLVCNFHNFILTTESDLKEHRDCPPVIETIPREVGGDNIIEKEDRATIEKKEKRIEEERKVKEGLLK